VNLNIPVPLLVLSLNSPNPLSNNDDSTEADDQAEIFELYDDCILSSIQAPN
jgi:hypothetical protein